MPSIVKPETPIESTSAKPSVIATPTLESSTNDIPVDPIQEVDALKSTLRDALIRVSRLSAVLRRQQRQSRLVKSTLLSLRQLGDVG